MTSDKQAEVIQAMEKKYVSVKSHKCSCGSIAGRVSGRVANIILEDEVGAAPDPLRCIMVTCGYCGMVTLYDSAVWNVQV
jgi:hypothetical protein